MSRKIKFKCRLASPTPVYEQREVVHVEEHDGEDVQVVSTESLDLTSPEAVATLQRADEFTLEAQLKSGVKLSALNVGDLLSPADVQTLDELGSRLGESLLNSIDENNN